MCIFNNQQCSEHIQRLVSELTQHSHIDLPWEPVIHGPLFCCSLTYRVSKWWPSVSKCTSHCDQSVDRRRVTESISHNGQNLLFCEKIHAALSAVWAVLFASPHWRAKRCNDFFRLASNQASISPSFSSVSTSLSTFLFIQHQFSGT
jgi:hypothetical protein